MSAQVTISLPLDTIAALQSNDATQLTPETIRNVAPALVNAIKALPVEFTQRRDSLSPLCHDGLTAIARNTPSTPKLPGAQGSLDVQKRGNGDVKSESESESNDGVVMGAWPRSSKFKIQVIPRGQPHRKLTLFVRPSYTIGTIKELVSETWTEFHTTIQRLVRPRGRGRSLDEDSRTLKDYYLEDGDVVYIETRHLLRNLQKRAAKDHAKFRIFVGTFSGKTLTFDVPLSTTIAQTKIMIRHREGVPMYLQRLLFGKVQLTEGLSAWGQGYHKSHYRTLKWCGIRSGDVLFLARVR